MYFGVDNDGMPVGLDDAQKAADDISCFIKERISPLPDINLTVHRVENDIDVLVLRVAGGNNTPYYYVGNGTTTAYIRLGNESIPASPQHLNELVMRGKNLTFDVNQRLFDKDVITDEMYARAKEIILKDFGTCAIS